MLLTGFGPPSECDVGRHLTLPTTPIIANATRFSIEFAFLRHNSLENRRKEHQVNELGIELCSSPRRDDTSRRIRAAPPAITPAVRHCVEGVGDGYDARRQRYFGSVKLVGIALSIPAFVVGKHALCQVWIEGSDGSENVCTALWMRRNLSSLGRSECRLLVDDIEKRLMDLSDVMKQSDALDDFHLVLGKIRRVGEDQCVRGNSSHMGARLCIVGVDRVQQRLERGGCKSFGSSAAISRTYEQCAARDTRSNRK